MRKTALASVTIIAVFLASTIFAVCFVKPAMAKTITVPDNYPTIQEAINAADDGDTVLVKKGIYNETLMVNKTISLIGEDRDSTIINARGAMVQVILVQRDYTTIANFTLGNNDFHPCTNSGWTQRNGEGDGIVIDHDVKAVNIINNRIISCPLHGINLLSGSRNYSVSGNTIINSITAIEVSGTNGVIMDNRFANCSHGVNFAAYEVRRGGQSWILSESNTVQGNQNITLSTYPTPFPSEPNNSTTPPPSLTPYLEPIITAAIVVSLSALGLGLIIYFKKRKH